MSTAMAVPAVSNIEDDASQSTIVVTATVTAVTVTVTTVMSIKIAASIDHIQTP